MNEPRPASVGVKMAIVPNKIKPNWQAASKIWRLFFGLILAVFGVTMAG